MMALPGEFRTDKVTSIEEAVRNLSAQQLAALPPLDDADFHLFGVIIQHFGFIDLNLRRAIEIFYIAKRLPDLASKAFPNLQDSALTDVLIAVIEGMEYGAEPVATVDQLKAIAQCRRYRNLIAHFAAKRYPGAMCLCLQASMIVTLGKSWAEPFPSIGSILLWQVGPSSTLWLEAWEICRLG